MMQELFDELQKGGRVMKNIKFLLNDQEVASQTTEDDIARAALAMISAKPLEVGPPESGRPKIQF